ncbi:ABC transporter substrate-binding protein [Dokdonia pacifica]|uniref:Iron complex transport system substrate-binding protein n=1 Tax=Dokdonia pacifica TaxID=1627892 RepID=A0A239D477_9FLAO|nr:ABC transporter substrate-binding protein [Dokdonia pacifica]GGG03697.1 ABC transporter substrate-binding protein [Dokdonia pacifica]SNS27087.1 iron complex transport system substrate-binding protein [Dokdonia pacifica]
MKLRHLQYTILVVISCCVLSCKKEIKEHIPVTKNEHKVAIKHAVGFSITEFPDYTLLKVTGAFPESEDVYRYALVKEGTSLTTSSAENTESLANLLESKKINAIVKVPLQSVVVTSTTHIPSLEMLGVDHTLSGFPHLDYISSEQTRTRIDAGEIKELGQNEAMNTEVAIDLNPDAVIGFGVDGQNKSLNSLERAGIPVLYNGDWVEKSPLGKAEWIKFFGALYGKTKEADSIFSTIETAYLDTKKLAQNVTNRPTVLSGAMYKDIWYLPHGESWPAQLIKDAGADYLWKDTKGTGSIALNIESVLEKGQDAHYWIAPGQFNSYSKLAEANKVYAQFDAFKNKKTYTFTSKKGATGGLLYYELAPNRPDIVLKDLVYYLHPELLPDYQPYFYTPFED